LQLIAKGLSNKEIAQALSLRPGTVRVYVSSIIERLGVSNRAEAATLALARGIIRLEEPPR
jgi:two-component system, NarL family, response regulator DevR